MRTFTTFLLLCFSVVANAQIDSVSQNKTIFHWVPKDPEELGYDSIGRQQGLWKESMEEILVLYDYHKSKIYQNVTAIGYYRDGKKVGTWDIYSQYSKLKKNLISQYFYQNDTIVYATYYKRNRIKSILRFEMKFRYNSFGYYYELIYKEIIVYNNIGKIKKRIYYAPDGVFEQIDY